MRGVSASLTALGVLAASFVTVFVLGAVTPAWAECNGPVTDTGICLGGTTPGNPGTETPGQPPGGGTNNECRDNSGNTIPCSDGFGGVWLGAPHNCYGFMLDPQPPADSPLWEGHSPDEGSVWSCDYTVSIEENTWFVPGAPPVVDGATVARTLAERAPFEIVELNVAPSPPNKSYVNLKNWLWIPDRQWHDISVSLGINGARVTMTAKPSRVQWDMGDGTTKSCLDTGRAWQQGLSDSAETTCGYTYSSTSPDGGYTITSRLYYDITWTCTGRCSAPSGSLGEWAAPSTTTSLVVGERQSVVIGGGN